MPDTREVKFTDNQKSVTWKYETLKRQNASFMLQPIFCHILRIL